MNEERPVSILRGLLTVNFTDEEAIEWTRHAVKTNEYWEYVEALVEFNAMCKSGPHSMGLYIAKLKNKTVAIMEIFYKWYNDEGKINDIILCDTKVK